MKKCLIALYSICISSLLMAGGDVAPRLPKVISIPHKSCKQAKIYIEKDVNLMWQDEAYRDIEDGAQKRNYSAQKAGTHAYALSYCRRLNYAGYSDWRLPTSDELTHLHAPQGKKFTYSIDNDFWSSTPATEGRYYVVFPADAMRYARSPKQSNYIRCVRCTVNDIKKIKKY